MPSPKRFADSVDGALEVTVVADVLAAGGASTAASSSSSEKVSTGEYTFITPGVGE